VAVIGLGSIGLEIGQAMSRLGVETTGIDQLEVVAQLQDPAVNKCVIDVVGKEFPLWLGTVAQLSKADNGVCVICGDNEVIVEKVFASLGRKPNLDKLGLENLPIEMDGRGIPVYDPLTMQVANLPIFIAGDVNADLAILHEAGHEGRVAGYNASREQVTAFKRKPKFGITFCDPNIATVGAQLSELNEADIVIGEIQFGPVGRALIIGKNRGVLRIYVQRSNGKLLGAAMACVKGENLAHLLAWSVQQDLTVFDLLKMPFYHPVIEEALQAALYSVLGELEIKQDVVELEALQN
jgi:dihydrolipoamide dehydrogenase